MTRPRKLPTVQELHTHAKALAKAFDVILIEDSHLTDNSYAQRLFADINIAHVMPIKCETTYAIALHEMGHLVHPTGMLTGSVGQEHDLLHERSAWEWAEYYALDWSPAMEQIKELGLGSYSRRMVA